MKLNKLNLIFFLIVLINNYNCTDNKQITISEYTIVPLPQVLNLNSDVLSLKEGFSIETEDKYLQKLQIILNDFQTLSNLNNNSTIKVEPRIDATYNDEHYQIKILNEKINISGGSYKALVYALTTLIQMSSHKTELHTGIVEDEPRYGYRGLMIDLSRNWHDIATLKQLIVLASYYKINYIQLHLTDDALFTFQSKVFPKLASTQSYSSEDLKLLNEFANDRGITLVPEIDVPGHSSGFIRAMPQLFGLTDPSKNSYTLNMGKETVYEALNTLFTEVAEAFPYSPYIHLGGDEVFTQGFENDTSVQEYLKENDLKNVDELYRHFLMRIAKIIKDKGKQPMLWSGFEREGSVEIPKDVIIMNWNPGAYTPKQMIEDGYTIINASWQPLYVVNNRKWSPKTIYQWEVTDWKGFDTPKNSPALKVPESKHLLGGSMEVWEQNQFKAYESLKERLPAMAEKLWGNTSKYSNFKSRVDVTSSLLNNALFPFDIVEEGLTYDKTIEPNFREDIWFQDTLKITLIPKEKNIQLRYTLDESSPTISSSLYIKPIQITKRSRFSVQAFKNGIPIKQALLKDYQLMPITFKIDGLYNNLQTNSWERHKFLDSIKITLNSKLKGDIYYTTDYSTPTSESNIYKTPFTMSNSGLLRARLFDESGNQIGSERREEYEQLGLETSLTTGKPVTTSNVYEAGRPNLITDGKISRWDHWGAHTDGNNWVVVDLGKEETISAFKIYTFWDNYRYYEYIISISNDKKNWKMVVDQSQNRKLSTPKGQLDSITPTKARYLKLQLLRNSANPGLHLVEFQAY